MATLYCPYPATPSLPLSLSLSLSLSLKQGDFSLVFVARRNILRRIFRTISQSIYQSSGFVSGPYVDCRLFAVHTNLVVPVRVPVPVPVPVHTNLVVSSGQRHSRCSSIIEPHVRQVRCVLCCIINYSNHVCTQTVAQQWTKKTKKNSLY